MGDKGELVLLLLPVSSAAAVDTAGTVGTGTASIVNAAGTAGIVEAAGTASTVYASGAAGTVEAAGTAGTVYAAGQLRCCRYS